jgi:hypothetical protein
VSLLTVETAQMGTKGVHMKGVLRWLVRWARSRSHSHLSSFFVSKGDFAFSLEVGGGRGGGMYRKSLVFFLIFI